jgi:hypothetical protein
VRATSGANKGRALFLVINLGPSGVLALPLTAGINVMDIVLGVIGPSGVCALPLATGINVGGHYFW